MQYWRDELGFRLQHLTIPIPSRAILSSVAIELKGMANSYLSDGDHFLSSSDAINALASWSYALGWLDAGDCLGLISAPVRDRCWIFSEITPCIWEKDCLLEKTDRYHALLSSALKSVVPAPEPETLMYETADRFILAANVSGHFGRYFLSIGRMQNALGAFSYGHAWLDAGVRTGLFRIFGKREIFTV